MTKLCRNLQRVPNNKIIFLDKTHIKINEVPRTTLVAPGGKLYVVVTDSSSYAADCNMIAAIVGSRVLLPIVFTPQCRRRDVKGIDSDMLIDFIENALYSSISESGSCPMYLLLDKSNIHNLSKLLLMLDVQK